MKKIGIVGSRKRNTAKDLELTTELFLACYRLGDELVSGGCPQGGDRFAEVLAKQFGLPILIFYPAWKTYGKGAGFVRNTDIAKNSDILIACVTKDRTGGTEDTVKKFLQRKSGNKLYLVPQVEGGETS